MDNAEAVFSFALKREAPGKKLESAERRKNIAAPNDHRSAPIAVGLVDAIQDIATDCDTPSPPDAPGCGGITAAQAWNTPDVPGAIMQVQKRNPMNRKLTSIVTILTLASWLAAVPHAGASVPSVETKLSPADSTLFQNFGW